MHAATVSPKTPLHAVTCGGSGLRRVFKKLVPPEEALNRLSELAPPRPLGVEEVGLLEAYGRVLAEDVRAPWNVPPFPKSLVDGYAVRSEDVRGAGEEEPVELRLAGRVPVGFDASGLRVEPGSAVEIDTGAMVPPGADAVVPVEYTEVRGGKILVYRSVTWGENVGWPGSDVYRGAVLARRGSRLGPALLGSLAAAGVGRVKVYRRPRVAVASSGDELVEPGRPLRPGTIHDANTYLLSAMLREIGAEPVVLGIVGDDEGEIEEALVKALKEADIVIFTGGTSAGPEDLVYRVIGRMGVIVAHGLKMKPGKPTVVGVVEGKPVFGLPGNPLSAAFVFRRVVAPYLASMMGTQAPEEQVLEAEVAVELPVERGRRTHQPVVLVWNRVRRVWSAYPVASKSYMIVSYTGSDGYVVIPETAFAPPGEGDVVEVHLHRIPGRSVRAVIGEYVDASLLPGEWRLIEAGTATALIARRRGDASLAVMSTLHPACPASVEGVRVSRRVVLASRTEEPRSVAAYPAGSGLEHLRRRVLEELGLEELGVVPVKGVRAAEALVRDGVVDAALLPAGLAKGLRVLGEWVEELVLAPLDGEAGKALEEALKQGEKFLAG